MSKEVMASGGDRTFLTAWGGAAALVSLLSMICAILCIVTLGLLGLCAYLGTQTGKRETYVFVKDHLGNVVQVNNESILRAGEVRDDAEVKGFIREWVHMGYVFTPLDVLDKAKEALTFVDAKAQGVAKVGMRLPERAKLAQNGISCKIYDDPQGDKQIEYVFESRKPLVVLVSFNRYQVFSDGRKQDMGRVFLRVEIKEIPRSPSFSNGLMVTDVTYSERLI